MTSTLIKSDIKQSEVATASLSVILSHNNDKREFIVHTINEDNGGRFNGYYTRSFQAAVSNYINRCNKLGITHNIA